jgi:multiple sugar transport system substrate-binding protein
MGASTSRRDFLRRGAGAGVLLSTGGLLAACGDSDPKSAATGAVADPSGAIRFLKGPNFADDLDWQRQVAAAFTEQHPKITVTPSLYDWASVETQLTTAFASNAPPDMIYMADTLWPKFADAGALLDLTKFVNDPSFKAEKDSYPKGAWESVTYDGKVFGLPLIQGVISVIYTNTDVLKAAGVTDAVSSYDAMRAAAKAAHKGKVFGYGMSTTHNDFSYQEWMNYVVNSGAAILGPDGRSGGFDTPENAQAFDLLRAIHAEDRSAPPPGAYNREALKGLFQAGRVAIYHSDANEKIISGKAEGKPVKFAYEVHKLPPGPAGAFVFTARGSIHVAAKSKSPEAAWEYAKFLTSARRETEFIRAQGGDLQPSRGDITDTVYPAGAAFDWSRRLVKEFIPEARSVQPHPRMIEMIKAVQSEFERCIRGQQSGAEMVAAANAKIGDLAA